MADLYGDFFDTLTKEDEERILDFTSDMYLFHEQDKQYLKRFYEKMENELNRVMAELEVTVTYIENGVNVVGNLEETKKYAFNIVELLVTMADFAALTSKWVAEKETAEEQAEMRYALCACIMRKYGRDYWERYKKYIGVSVDTMVVYCRRKFEEELGWTLANIKKDYPDFMEKTVEMRKNR